MIELTLRELSAQLCPAAKSTPPSPTFPTSVVLDVYVVKDSEYGLKELSLNHFYQICSVSAPRWTWVLDYGHVYILVAEACAVVGWADQNQGTRGGFWLLVID